MIVFDDSSLAARNINLLKWLAPFRTLSVSAAYLQPFFEYYGTTKAEIFWLQTIFSLTLVAWEIPSGMLADRFGRVRCIKVSVPIVALTMIGYSLSHTFWLFAVCEVTLALGIGLYSGADGALVRDSLKAVGLNGQVLDAQQTAANQSIKQFGFGGTLVCIPVTWVLYTYFGLSSLILADGVLVTIGLWFAWRLVEAPRTNGGLAKQGKQTWSALRQLIRIGEARWLIVLTTVLNTATYMAAWLTVPYYELLGIPAVTFGLWLGLRCGFKFGLAHVSERFGWQELRKRHMLVYAGLSGAVYLAMTISTWGGDWRSPLWWLVLAVLGHDVIHALQDQPIITRLNRHMHQGLMASMNSVSNQASRISFAVIGPLVGYMTDGIGLQMTFVITGVLCALLSLLAVFRLDRLHTF